MRDGNDPKLRIAARAALELFAGARVNLGIGLPTLIPDFVPPELDVWFHSENGFLGMGAEAASDSKDGDLIDAGGRYVTLRSGGVYFDSATSFAMIRGKRLDVSFLGAFQVDAEGNLANWRVPGRITPGIGGAMELAQKVPQRIVTSLHTASDGTPKLLTRCTLPLTAPKAIDVIITELAVLKPAGASFQVLELAPGVTKQELIRVTDAPLDFAFVTPWQTATLSRTSP